MTCAICHIRKPRRFCPGVRGDICTICCGKEREVTVDCPLDCEFLLEARKHEHTKPAEGQAVPSADIAVTEEFLEEHADLLANVARAVARAAFETPGAVDRDTRQALDALVQTYRTMQSGVYYQTRPDNMLAAGILDATLRGIDEIHKLEQEQFQATRSRDGDVLRVLIFLQRLGWVEDNGRPRGRAFLDMLRRSFENIGVDVPAPKASSLILP
jgi:hypothetical protein